MGRPSQRPRPAYGQHLTALREAAGLTQQQLADKLGVQQSCIAFWERWDKPPRGEVLPKLAQALKVDVDTILNFKAPKTNGGPRGKARQVLEALSRLPRRQQEQIIRVVNALIAQSAGLEKKTA